MSLVPGHIEGGFGLPGFEGASKPTVAPSIGRKVVYPMSINPADKSTIISLIPKAIVEYKPTIFPSKFRIEAAKPGSFELLVVTPSSWWMQSSIERVPPTEIQVNSFELAKSIVKDYLTSMFLCDMGNRMPGLFCIPGSYDKSTILKYKDEHGVGFDAHFKFWETKQRNWMLELVRVADQLWSRSNGNPIAIPDDARLSAEILGLKEKPWMQDFKAMEMSPCKSCGEMINYNYPVCKHCHAVIDEAKAKDLNIRFADR